MEKVYVVMQSTENHDAYDNFGDFMLGVKLGAYGFVNTLDFEFPSETWGAEEGEMDIITVFANDVVPVPHQEVLTQLFYQMREERAIHGVEIRTMGEREYHCYEWYEDAIRAFEQETGRSLPNLR